MSFGLSNIYKSLVRHLVDTVAEIERSGASPDIEYYPWDSRGDQSELPTKDLIGLAGWTFKEDKGLWLIHTGITLSTFNDENLFREIAILDVIHDMWGEGQTVLLRDNAGNEITQLVVSDFEMMPAGTSEKRNMRPVGIELLRTAPGG
jgi:hypothetical protein